ncbi:MAG: hypothetical protein HY815_16020 [Candidatus Riflebacteria bacterium]|nr:hypothetical protein [Candidatus Riflebacteria bacterium]
MTARTMLAILVLWALTASWAVAGPVNATLGRAVQPTNVLWLARSLTAGWHTFETRSLSAGGDTVLYVIGGGAQIARNDDRTVDSTTYGARSSRIYCSVPTPGWYYLLVRAYSNTTAGTCDVYIDGTLATSGSRFGGHIVTTGWDPGDRFQIAHYNSASYNATDTVLYAFSANGNYVGRNDDGGCNLTSRLQMSYAETTGQILIAKYGLTPPTALDQVRFVINPLSKGDTDADNVANALETWQGTNVGVADSDNDGLADDWEIFGLVTPYGDEDLPAYGASPVLKDLFVEMDYMARSTGGNLAPQAASVQRVVTAFWNHGIALHVDQGQLGSRSSRGGQVGDWRIPFEPGCPLATTAHTPKDNVYSYWSDSVWFAPSRRHLFLYQFMGSSHNALGGGSTGCASNSFTVAGDLSGAGQCTANLVNMWTGILGNVTKESGTIMHESGHNLNIWHGGSDSRNYKPNFTSTMNYLYQLRAPSPSGNPNYSDVALPNLDESALREPNGIEPTPVDDHVYNIIRNNIGAVDVRSPTYPLAFDWNRSGAVNTIGNVAADINTDGIQTVLTGNNDWATVRAGAPSGRSRRPGGTAVRQAFRSAGAAAADRSRAW